MRDQFSSLPLWKFCHNLINPVQLAGLDKAFVKSWLLPHAPQISPGSTLHGCGSDLQRGSRGIPKPVSAEVWKCSLGAALSHTETKSFLEILQFRRDGYKGLFLCSLLFSHSWLFLCTSDCCILPTAIFVLAPHFFFLYKPLFLYVKKYT